MHSLFKTLAVTLVATALLALGWSSSATAQSPAQDAAQPTQNPTQYTQIDVLHRADPDSTMYFAGGDVTLTALVTLCEPQMSIKVTLVVPSGEMTRRQATEALADKIREALPEDSTSEVSHAGGTITVTNTCATDALGTPDEPLDHPNDGNNVNTNRPRTSQFSSK